MTEIRYANLQTAPTNVRVTQVGSQAGPPAGDGWAIVSRLSPASMFGTGQYAVIVSGTFGDNLIVGATPQWGVMQLCLGTVGGTKHTEFLTSLPLIHALQPMRGQPFQFMVLISSGFPDSLFGSSFNPATTEMCLWARTFYNGDPALYSVEFTVADVSWLVFNLDDIPAGEWVAHTTSPSSPLTLPGAINPAAFVDVASTAAASGGSGAVWLHFANYWVRTFTPVGVNAPRLKTSLTPDGTPGAAIAKIGTGDRWGFHRVAATPTPNTPNEYHIGGFFVHQHTTSTTKVGFFADAGGTAATVMRWRWFALRIDTLPDVRWVNQPLQQSAGGPISGPWEQAPYITIERPEAGMLTEPICMAHFTALVPPNTGGYAAFVTEAGSGQTTTLRQTDCFPRADPQRVEGASSMVFGRRQFQVLSPAMQWRVHAVGDPATPPGPFHIFDFTFVQFHPVRDPNNISTPPGSLPPPIVVLPGFQSAEAGSLPLPPFPPNANPVERGQDERESIRGGTGYVRRWPRGASILRQFTVSWGPMREVDGHTLFKFLTGLVAWRYQPPRGAAVAVLNLGNPELVPTGHRTVTVQVDVGVPVFRG